MSSPKASKAKPEKPEPAREQASDQVALAAARADLEHTPIFRVPRDPLELARSQAEERAKRR